MKTLIAILTLISISTFTYANDLYWYENYNDALDKAANDNKFVLADFTGSDWCPWCIKLEEEVFDKPEFESYAEENLVLLKVDFPQSKELSNEIKKQNGLLEDKYNVDGFPTVLILDKEGEIVDRMGYQEGGPIPYVDTIKKSISDYQVQY